MADDRNRAPHQDAAQGGRNGDPGTDPWASRRRKNLAIFSAILALAALFFVITILRMS